MHPYHHRHKRRMYRFVDLEHSTYHPYQVCLQYLQLRQQEPVGHQQRTVIVLGRVLPHAGLHPVRENLRLYFLYCYFGRKQLRHRCFLCFLRRAPRQQPPPPPGGQGDLAHGHPPQPAAQGLHTKYHEVEQQQNGAHPVLFPPCNFLI